MTMKEKYTFSKMDKIRLSILSTEKNVEKL